MNEIVLHNLDPVLIERLRQEAERHGRTIEGEAKAILASSVGVSRSLALRLADEFRSQFTGRVFSDSAELIREDRER